jgi:L-seryl-tRNA(Ser) seleniumtransferase
VSETDPRRLLPAVDAVLARPELHAALAERPRAAVIAAARSVLERAREELAAREGAPPLPAIEVLCEQIRDRLAHQSRPALRRAINATGVVLHTGLGRAVLGEAARHAVAEVSRGYGLLEIDPESGARGVREHEVARLAAELSGAEAATVVNNCAAACLLMLAALCRGREVIVARGQLVEIGGSFRIPEIMEQSGARLREVGATNRVHLRDYREAIGPETAAILKVHTANFRVVGFHKEVPLGELAALAAEHDLHLLEDLGSGNLVDLPALGLPHEPVVGASVAAGAHVVIFSGDKLLGGPQAGIACGRAAEIAAMRRHPLFRAVRPDKLQLAALAATLRAHRDGIAREALPTIAMLATPALELNNRAEAIARTLTAPPATELEVEVVKSEARAGSGALPAAPIPSVALALRHPKRSAEDLARALRTGEPPVFPRIERDRVLCDLRTVLPEEDAELAGALRGAVALEG